MCRGNLAREAYVYQGTYKGGIFEEGRISDILFQYILPNVCCATSDVVLAGYANPYARGPYC